jgi:hypothetical protein
MGKSFLLPAHLENFIPLWQGQLVTASGQTAPPVAQGTMQFFPVPR